MCRRAPLLNTTPDMPVAPRPSKVKPRKLMASLAPALMTMLLVPETVAAPASPSVPPSMLIALVMVAAPKSPGSRTSISPPAAVCTSATAKVKQGAVRVHGLESLPEAAETHVWVACGAPLPLKAADTLVAALIVTAQLPLPLHTPPQPSKAAPWAGVAVSVTCVPLPKLELHVAPQLMPEGELVTVPLPKRLTESG